MLISQHCIYVVTTLCNDTTSQQRCVKVVCETTLPQLRSNVVVTLYVSWVWRQNTSWRHKVRHDVKTRPDVKKFFMTSKRRHEVKKFVIASKTRYDARKFAMTSKTRHDVKRFPMALKTRKDVKDTSWRHTGLFPDRYDPCYSMP